MNTIWKIPLRPLERQEILVPAGAELLCAREQFNDVCVWFRCDPEQPKEPRKLAIAMTGAPCPGGEGRYLGMASLEGGRLICHVFEIISR